MNVTINGAPAELPADATVADAVLVLVDDVRGVAVAVDAEVVPQAQWVDRRLHENASVEVVRAIQGG